jgi:Uma2 family endonuclease
MDPAALVAELPQRRFTHAEYHQMVEAGILGEDERVELLHGRIVTMMSPNPPHARATSELNARLVAAAEAAGLRVRIQMPLEMPDDSEPEPDVAVVSRREEVEAPWHPRAALLVVEVSGSSPRVDRKIKAPLYASAGIPEYWIVDLDHRMVEVYLEPDQGRYTAMRTVEPGETLSPRCLPDVKVDVSALFPR